MILCHNSCYNPPVTDIVWGICGTDSTDFGDYYIIEPNKVFELDAQNQTKNLRVGIKLISSPVSTPIIDEFSLMFSLANNAITRLNLAASVPSSSGQLGPVSGITSVISTEVQGHTHLVSFSSSINNAFDVNTTSSISGGHAHQIVSGIFQPSASHVHTWVFP